MAPPLRVSLRRTGAGNGLPVGDGGLSVARPRTDGSTLHVTMESATSRSGLRSQDRGHNLSSVTARVAVTAGRGWAGDRLTLVGPVLGLGLGARDRSVIGAVTAGRRKTRDNR